MTHSSYTDAECITWAEQTIRCSPADDVYRKIKVVQFCPYFLFLGMVLILKQKKIKFETKNQIEPQHRHPINPSSFVTLEKEIDSAKRFNFLLYLLFLLGHQFL